MQITLFQQTPTKRTSKRRFFEEITPFLHIDTWLTLIEPYYYKSHKGRNRKNLEIMLRTLLVRIFFGLSYEKTEDEIHENLSVRNFVGVTKDEEIPDASSICRFEQLLTKNKLQEQMFVQHVDHLVLNGKLVKIGSNIDSTIVDAPTSTKNKDKKRDSEAGWTKKAGKHRHGFKGHIGQDEDSGLIHSNTMTAANVHDLHAVEDCLHGEERHMSGDSAYLGVENHSEKAKKMKRRVLKRRSSIAKMEPRRQELERRRAQAISSKRAKVEHPFLVVKRIFGWNYTRVRGLEKNAARFNMMCMLANIYKLSRPSPV